jgi:alpha-tubulin N-acetyltransferase 1
MMVGGKKCLGLLKIGKRNLFIRNESGMMKEIKPLCVLDFYVHESVQRNGIGKVILVS